MILLLLRRRRRLTVRLWILSSKDFIHEAR